jgi:serine phosphatase RsbU (regulator of sigma subunit)
VLKNSIEFINQYICRVHKSAMFASLFFGVLDPKSALLSYINAGLEPPLVLRHGKLLTELMPTGPIVGGIEDIHFDVGETDLDPDDIILIYTDGITDACNADDEEFGRERVMSIAENYSTSADSLIDRIVNDVKTFVDQAAQFDDITLMAVQRTN